MQAHVVDSGTCPLHLDVPQLGLKVLDVAAAIAYLAVQTRKDGRIVGRLAHDIGGVDQSPFLVNFLLHLADGLVDGSHGSEGCALSCGGVPGGVPGGLGGERRGCPSGLWHRLEAKTACGCKERICRSYRATDASE